MTLIKSTNRVKKIRLVEGPFRIRVFSFRVGVFRVLPQEDHSAFVGIALILSASWHMPSIHSLFLCAMVEVQDSALYSIGCDNTCFENLKVVRLAFVFLRLGSNSFFFFPYLG